MRPDHIRPLQMSADHIRPDHMRPDQVVSVQVLPLKAPPVQLVPARLLAAQLRLSKATPKMSCSPWSSTVPSLRWLVPRAASRDPAPVAAVKRWVAVVVAVFSALTRSRLPAPWAVAVKPVRDGRSW